MNRGAGRRAVFTAEAERRLFLGLLAELNEAFGAQSTPIA